MSCFAFLLGSALTLTLNAIPQLFGRWTSEGESIRVVRAYGNQLEKLFYRALLEEEQIIVTLRNGKVYIGRVTHSLNKGIEDFNLLPSKSGFRDAQQRLMITTDYDRIYATITSQYDKNYIEIIGAFGVVIKVNEVLTASLYLETIHNRYFPDCYSLEVAQNRVIDNVV
jgi:hypothetical protein